MKQLPAKKDKYAIPGRFADASLALDRAWQLLREIEPSIPEAVTTFVDAFSRRRVYGYFQAATWKKRRGHAHEISVSPSLISHPADLLETLLHEAAHAILHDAGKHAGIGHSVYYHTAVFRDQCLVLGLSCGFLNTRYGFTLTGWPNGRVDARYADVIRCLRAGLPAGTDGATRQQETRPLPPSGQLRLVCGCTQPKRAIFVKRGAVSTGGIRCDLCGALFGPPGETGAR